VVKVGCWELEGLKGVTPVKGELCVCDCIETRRKLKLKY